MLDNIMKFREPVAWVVVLAALASIVLALVGFGLGLTSGASVFASAQNVANSAMNLSLVVMVIGVVCACLFVAPMTPRAVLLTRVAAVVVTTGTILTLVAALLGVSASAGTLPLILEFLGGLLDVVLKGVASAALWLMHRAITAGRMTTAEPAAVVAEVEAAPTTSAAPVWRPSEASGSVWTSAADAAGGAPASAHGAPGASGWRPVSRPAATPTSTDQSLPGA